MGIQGPMIVETLDTCDMQGLGFGASALDPIWVYLTGQTHGTKFRHHTKLKIAPLQYKT